MAFSAARTALPMVAPSTEPPAAFGTVARLIVATFAMSLAAQSPTASVPASFSPLRTSSLTELPEMATVLPMVELIDPLQASANVVLAEAVPPPRNAPAPSSLEPSRRG